jgi:hypothetical protein
MTYSTPPERNLETPKCDLLSAMRFEGLSARIEAVPRNAWDKKQLLEILE